MKKRLEEVAFEARDTLGDMANMLCLVEHTISSHEDCAQEAHMKGTSSLLWQIIEMTNKLEKELEKYLKGEAL